MDSTNPATGAVIDSYDTDDSAAVEAALSRADDRFTEWSERPLREREQYLESVAAQLRDERDEYAELMTREMGKPIEQARSEVEKCAWVCEHYAEHAGAYLSATGHPSPPGAAVETVYEPLGPVLAVMPWNFPFWQVFRFAAPALAAGNVALLKHAPEVPGCARTIAEIFDDAGLPDGVFESLLVEEDRVAQILEDERVTAATLTGSGRAGSAVASKAGAELKKTVLELGGSDPFVVLDDADIDAATETGAWARALNGGQSCIAAKRFVVHTAVYDDFLDALVGELESLTVGDPTDETTEVGPLHSQDALDRIDEQVSESVAAGATVETGGQPLDRTGAFYPPTVLTDVPEGSPADTEELFGPAAAVYEVADEREAIRVANDTDFGLGASVWTADRERGRRLAGEIEAGQVYVNQLVKSDPRVPFGGIEQSGYGRELAGEGIREFVNRKTVWVE
jgi:succinate-semialdehyde dehydrogenase/glutarate-semialdehyde dehydrogenase